jgi:hypothetical protein
VTEVGVTEHVAAVMFSVQANATFPLKPVGVT